MRNWSPDIGALLSSTNAWLSVVAESAARSEAPVSPSRRFSMPRAPLKPFRMLKLKRQESRVVDAVGQEILFTGNEDCSPGKLKTRHSWSSSAFATRRSQKAGVGKAVLHW